MKVSLTEATPNKSKDKSVKPLSSVSEAFLIIPSRFLGSTPAVSEDGSADDGVIIHNDSPAVAHSGSASSPSARKA